MWIRIGDVGTQLRENDCLRLWINTRKSRGRGKPKYEIISTEVITGYEEVLFTFNDYTKASEALYKIVTALDERRARIEL